MALGFIVGGATSALGAVVLGYAALVWRRASASARWPSAEGVLEHGEVEEVEHWSRAGSYIGYGLALRYRYVVAGRVHLGSRWTFGCPDFPTSDEATEALRRLQDAEIRVHYRPDDPAVSVLEPGTTPGVGRLAAIGLSMFLTGICLLTWG